MTTVTPSPAPTDACAATVSVQDFRNGMARLPGAVTVITTDGAAGLAGFTATAVCSVTDSPPTLLVCMNRGSWAHPRFVTNGVLCVNVLSGEQESLSALFSNRDVPMDERFTRCGWDRLATGAPALQGAAVQFDGRITATHEVGTHSVFMVELAQVRSTPAAAPAGALAYFDRRYHTLGEVAA
jgi:flavin reductase